MLRWALIFLVVALIVNFLDSVEQRGEAAWIAYVLSSLRSFL